MNKRFSTALLSAIGILVLILDAKTAISGASEGIKLCIYTIIPSLLPFFVLSILLTASLLGSKIRLLRPICWMCGIPEGCESILLCGALGGYPTGAQAVTNCWRSGSLDAASASRMLVICNLAGPSFLFGIVGSQFSRYSAVWYLWMIHIFSAIFTAAIVPRGSSHTVCISQSPSLSLMDAVSRSLRVMATVCGWIVLFRVLLAFLRHWFLWLLPADIQVLLCGVLELANGCCSLHRIAKEGLRFVIAAGMLSFGGLCVIMQTASVSQGLNFSGYLPGKLLQAVISLTLAMILQIFLFTPAEQMPLFPLIAPLQVSLLLIGVKILRKYKIYSRISQPIGV